MVGAKSLPEQELSSAMTVDWEAEVASLLASLLGKVISLLTARERVSPETPAMAMLPVDAVESPGVAEATEPERELLVGELDRLPKGAIGRLPISGSLRGGKRMLRPCAATCRLSQLPRTAAPAWDAGGAAGAAATIPMVGGVARARMGAARFEVPALAATAEALTSAGAAGKLEPPAAVPGSGTAATAATSVAAGALSPVASA